MLNLDMKYYMFDWDDNILTMPTRIHLEERQSDGSWSPIQVTTSHFASIRSDTENYRAPGGDWGQAFSEFHDLGDRGEDAFLDDTRKALDEVLKGRSPPAPSFTKFKKCLREGRLFAIITARSHSSSAIRKGVEYFIQHALTPSERRAMLDHLHQYGEYFDREERSDEEVLDRYLSLNRYRGVTSPEFMDEQGIDSKGAERPEYAKQLAVREFVEHIGRILGPQSEHFSVSIGFSDDDVHNVTAIEDFVRDEMKRVFPEVKFVLYDTSDGDQGGSRKFVIET